MSELEQIKQRLDELEAENEQLRNRVDSLEAENDQLRDRVDELEEQPTVEIENERNPIGSLKIGEAYVGEAITGRVSEYDLELEIADLKADLEAQTQGVEQGETTVQQHETSLEQVAAMPEHMVDDQLSPNQQRARHVALHIADYATKTNKGRILRAGDLRTVLQARFDTGHSETVDRVRDFLDRLGGDLVEVVEPQTAGYSPDKKGEKKRQGKKIVVDEQLAYSLHQIREDHDVVTGAEA